MQHWVGLFQIAHANTFAVLENLGLKLFLPLQLSLFLICSNECLSRFFRESDDAALFQSHQFTRGELGRQDSVSVFLTQFLVKHRVPVAQLLHVYTALSCNKLSYFADAGAD